MKLLTRLGWGLVAVGAFLMISTISPAGMLLMLIGVPLVFVGSTMRAVRAQTQAADDDSENGSKRRDENA